MSPYQRAAAVAVASHPVAPAPSRAGTTRQRWPGRGDRAAQAVLGSAVAVVLAAMGVNWLDGFLDLFGHTPGGRDAALRTWALDAVTVVVLGAVGVVHSAVRRGRPGRWPLTLAGLVVAASVVLVPVVVG